MSRMIQWATGLSTSQSTSAIDLRKSSTIWVSVIDGGGTGFNSGTATLQQSFDNGTTWISFVADGTAVTFTTNNNRKFDAPAGMYRLTNDGTVSDVDVYYDGASIGAAAI